MRIHPAARDSAASATKRTLPPSAGEIRKIVPVLQTSVLDCHKLCVCVYIYTYTYVYIYIYTYTYIYNLFITIHILSIQYVKLYHTYIHYIILYIYIYYIYNVIDPCCILTSSMTFPKRPGVDRSGPTNSPGWACSVLAPRKTPPRQSGVDQTGIWGRHREKLINIYWLVNNGLIMGNILLMMMVIIEGSLEVKLPTIWTVEKQRWEESEEKRSEERRCRCAKR